MRVEYGPPGHKGVTQIMGLGNTSAVTMSKTHRNVGLLSLATWVGGAVMGSNTAKNIGIGGLLATVYIQVLNKKAETVQPTQQIQLPPIDMQGWG